MQVIANSSSLLLTAHYYEEADVVMQVNHQLVVKLYIFRISSRVELVITESLIVPK